MGLADGMVSGAAHTTAHTIRPRSSSSRPRRAPRSCPASSSCAWPTGCSSTATARSTRPRPPSSWPTSRSPRRTPRRSSASSRGWRCCRTRPGPPAPAPTSTRCARRPRWSARCARTCWSRARSSTTRRSTRTVAAHQAAGLRRWPAGPRCSSSPTSTPATTPTRRCSAPRARSRSGRCCRACDKPVNDLSRGRAGARHRQHGGDHRHPGAEPGSRAQGAAVADCGRAAVSPRPRPQLRVVVAEVPAARPHGGTPPRVRARRADRRGGGAHRAHRAGGPTTAGGPDRHPSRTPCDRARGVRGLGPRWPTRRGRGRAPGGARRRRSSPSRRSSTTTWSPTIERARPARAAAQPGQPRRHRGRPRPAARPARRSRSSTPPSTRDCRRRAPRYALDRDVAGRHASAGTASTAPRTRTSSGRAAELLGGTRRDAQHDHPAPGQRRVAPPRSRAGGASTPRWA